MELPKNRFKEALQKSDALQLGCWAGFAHSYAAEILATVGYDWLLVDGEHAPNTVQTLLTQLQALAPYRSAPVVRIPNHDPSLIKQVLDIGTLSLMVPMVESEEQAKALVRAMRYPPYGIRGVGGGLARATVWDGVENYLETAHQEQCLVVQIESPTGVEHVETIAATEGVDALFVGPADLSLGMGHPNNPNHPEVQAAIARVLKAAQANGKACGILAPRLEDARRYEAQGFRFIAIGIDISFLKQAAQQKLQAYRDETGVTTGERATY
ncbi:2-dehydro-3-deoxyglucarate aldolase [Marinobacter lutaoensis]|uniref:2-dehydro-3-deoxyglucarate aldolase n=1 Tax=Marinobacter lutaoensis TaxID=135739 RepID=A0A1V2DS17_9GAMM|nr:HpcH/HpaI aldolase/citrate lyase family protein [Marinobacter lutaoensis]ONF43422.1 2-dehydro-3-deoxyglucarate aldolase [Marinobacter lutaoensis]